MILIRESENVQLSIQSMHLIKIEKSSDFIIKMISIKEKKEMQLYYLS